MSDRMAASSAPGFLEAVLFKSRNHIEGLESSMIIDFGLSGTEVVAGAEEAMVVGHWVIAVPGGAP